MQPRGGGAHPPERGLPHGTDQPDRRDHDVVGRFAVANDRRRRRGQANRTWVMGRRPEFLQVCTRRARVAFRSLRLQRLQSRRSPIQKGRNGSRRKRTPLQRSCPSVTGTIDKVVAQTQDGAPPSSWSIALGIYSGFTFPLACPTYHAARDKLKVCTATKDRRRDLDHGSSQGNCQRRIHISDERRSGPLLDRPIGRVIVHCQTRQMTR